MRWMIKLAAGLLVASATGTAFAQVTPQQQSAIRSNCRSDFMSKCPGVTPGGKDALTCLQSNVATLSAGCKTAVSATLPKAAPATAAASPPPLASPSPAPAATAPAASPWPATAAAAQPAVPAATAPKPPAAPKPVAAAKPATPKPPAAAKPAMAKPAIAPVAAVPAITLTSEQAAAIKFTCSRDVGEHCKGISAGSPESYACLQQNSEKLSPDCRTSVAAVEENAADDEDTPGAAATAPGPKLPRAPVANAAVTLRACKLDLVRHCASVPVGDGRKLACLNDHNAELSIRCRTALKVTAPIR